MDDDVELEARIRAAPAEARQRLADAMAALVAELGPRPVVAWSARPEQVPYPLYPDAVWRLVDALTAMGAGPAFDWMHWSQARMTVEDLRGAPLADVARMLTVLVRGERFVDGTMARALQDGALVVIAERVLAATH